MKKLNLIALFSALLFMYSCDNNPNSNRQDSAEVAEERNEERLADRDNLKEDSEFVVEAAGSSMMEIELGQLAVQKANSQEVKNFAQKMVDDHSRANEKLKQIAQRKNIALPNGIPNDHRKHIDDLREKSGREFDKEYMDLMVSEHKDDVSKFEDAADDLNDNEIKSFAQETLPKLRQHREEAEQIHERIKERS
ncbi:MAG: DUF4142 domain-containing protein [Bacteroidota bacterium]|jgi:putative membrane protein|nr:DUF4142 domain-containing protein [Bacteroidota bacterium]